MRDIADATVAVPEKATNTIEDKKDNSSSEEFTMDDVNKMKAELISASMPEKHVNILGNIIEKLTQNTTTDEKIDGFVSVKLVACGTLNALSIFLGYKKVEKKKSN